MSLNLLEEVNQYFNNNLVSQAALSLGEGEASIQKALGGVIPSVLAGIIGKAGTSSGADTVINLARQVRNSGWL